MVGGVESSTVLDVREAHESMMNDSPVLKLQRRLRDALQSGDYPAAIAFLQQAAAQAHEDGDRGAEGRHLGNLALIYNRLQRPHDALTYFQQALELARAEGDRVTEDGLLGNMGNILREIGHPADAADYLNHALLIAQEIGDVRGRGIWLSNLGLVYADLNQPQKALDYHQQAVDVARQLHDARGLALRLIKLAATHYTLGDFPAALQAYGESLEICRVINETQGALECLTGIGHLYHEAARHADSDRFFHRAIEAYRNALVLAREHANAVAEADLLASLGSTYGNLRDYAAAIEQFKAAQTIYSALGHLDRGAAMQESIRLAISLNSQ